MLTIVVPATELFDESKSEFVNTKAVTLKLEHSLVSLSKWEADYEKPFLDRVEKTDEETLGYIKAMTVTSNVPEEVYQRLSSGNLADINAYIDRKMSATWFGEDPGAPKSRDIVTSELIYYWMIIFQIPLECEKWHLNRLFTLIRVCNTKQSKPQKMSRSEQAARRSQLNDQRKRALGTTG